MPAKPKPQRRSSCPVNASLEILGDRWSLLIIRDLMLRSCRTYKEFLSSDEGIATNILAERLKRLEAAGIISTSGDAEDRRKVVYRLTAKGIDLAPIVVELILWGAQHEATGAPPAAIRRMRARREQFLSEIRRNWEEGGTAVFIASPRKG
ncbi:MAG TPA: helix-turn-helix domain-containing protein [Thermoanaerobaculia bacterium]|nr:helix-turn-helix domain-containing protein [Thermoanaerobaculia bacterium]